MFSGDPAPNSSSVVEETNSSMIIERFKMRAAETAKSFLLDMWLARHTPEKVLPLLYSVLEGAKQEFADAVANGGGIYSAGYCFGARYTILLAREQPNGVLQTRKVVDEEAGVVSHGPFIKTGAVAHGTLVTKEDFEGLKAPLTFACVEDDQLFPEDVRKAGEDYCAKHNVENEFRTYSGVPHGKPCYITASLCIS